MKSVRVSQPSDITDISLIDEYQQFKVWVDQDEDGNWEVLLKSNNYKFGSLTIIKLNIKLSKSLWWMTWFAQAMKDVASYDKLRGGASSL